MTTRSIASSLLAASFVMGVAVHAAGAQTLADLAKKEEERRKTTAPPAATKTYTNKDLGAPLPPTSTPGGSSADSVKDATKDPADPNAKDAGAPKDAANAAPAKDQKYWSDRIKSLREKLSQDETFADAIQVKINSLTTDFVNRDDPAQRAVIEQNRQKSLAELERLRLAIIADKKAITDLEEEARKANVPPGWLR